MRKFWDRYGDAIVLGAFLGTLLAVRDIAAQKAAVRAMQAEADRLASEALGG